jgi:hypothetical protein
LVLPNPDPDPTIIKQNGKKNLDFYSLKNDVNEPSKSNKQNKQKLFFVGVLKVTYEKSWIRIRIRIRWSEVRIRGSGSVPKCQDPDPGNGSGMNIPDHISKSLDTIFWVKNA